jgi:hypothetical protein
MTNARTNAPAGVAVVTMQIALTDRRALSQAWYSALHLARATAPPAGPTRRAAAAVAPAHAAPAQAHAGRDAHPWTAPLATPRAARAVAPRGIGADERRRAVTETDRRLGRAIATLAARPRRPLAHTVDVAGGRVRLLVQSDGRTTRIVALCSAALREPVGRALARARFALAGAGIAVAAP